MQPVIDWANEFPAPITVCDRNGIVRFMNQRACQTFAQYGGAALVGQDLMDCHPGESKDKLQELLQRPRVNAYTIEKNGKKKLIYQAPWHQGGAYQGLVEIAIELPESLPHFARQQRLAGA